MPTPHPKAETRQRAPQDWRVHYAVIGLAGIVGLTVAVVLMVVGR